MGDYWSYLQAVKMFVLWIIAFLVVHNISLTAATGKKTILDMKTQEVLKIRMWEKVSDVTQF